MIEFDTQEIRKAMKSMMPAADIDSEYNFYYDETNNIKKFYVKDADYNYSYDSNFVLGGLVFEGDKPDINDIFNNLNLQSTVKEVKLKHIAKGDFLNCLKSQKLFSFLKYLVESKLYIHYSTINILYFSIVDIVDSAIANSDVSMKLGPEFVNILKNDLYKLCKLEREATIEIFHKYQYPNIKKESILSFIKELTLIFEDYENDQEFHFGITSLKQILRESEMKGSLPFIMDEEDYILLKDFSHFYLRPIYTFKSSNHVFDNEDSIQEIISQYRIKYGDEIITSYNFVDSENNLFIQASDIFIGLVGKLSKFINTNSEVQIKNISSTLSEIQKKNLAKYYDLVDKSENRNMIFLHNISSVDDMNKMKALYEVRKKLQSAKKQTGGKC